MGTSSDSDASGLLRSALVNELANLSNVELFIQAAIAVFVIVNPVDPVKVIGPPDRDNLILDVLPSPGNMKFDALAKLHKKAEA